MATRPSHRLHLALGFWLLGPSEAPSLSKFLSPVATAVLVAIGAAAALAQTLRPRQAG